MADEQPCTVCSAPAAEACVRCKQPTCPEHFNDNHDLQICEACWQEVTTSGRPILQWPYPRRSEGDGSATS